VGGHPSHHLPLLRAGPYSFLTMGRRGGSLAAAAARSCSCVLLHRQASQVVAMHGPSRTRSHRWGRQTCQCNICAGATQCALHIVHGVADSQALQCCFVPRYVHLALVPAMEGRVGEGGERGGGVCGEGGEGGRETLGLSLLRCRAAALLRDKQKCALLSLRLVPLTDGQLESELERGAIAAGQPPSPARALILVYDV
jgi:hypothetical protein